MIEAARRLHWSAAYCTVHKQALIRLPSPFPPRPRPRPRRESPVAHHAHLQLKFGDCQVNVLRPH